MGNDAFTPETHWSTIWSTREADAVTWFQRHPTVSLDLLTSTEPRRDAAIIDVGGGGSTLVDHLLDLGYRDLTVLDVAEPGLEQTRQRLGTRADDVHWIDADVTTHRFERDYDLWHDRAVFHFLVDAVDRRRYVEAATRWVKPGGHLVIATFAVDGPEQCSGLPVERYSPERLAAQFALAFTPVATMDDLHRTPSGGAQHFVYLVLQRG